VAVYWEEQAYVRDNIKRDLHELGWRTLDWIDVAHDKNRCWAFVNAVMSLQIP